MPSSTLSLKQTLIDYAQGAAQSNVQPVADFIAPGVDVARPVGYYKVYNEKSRFRIPDTRRAMGGRATRIGFDASDSTYNCKPNAIDYPIDYDEVGNDEFDNLVQEGSRTVAEIGALAHEKFVISKALAAAGNGTGLNWTGNNPTDPVDDLDTVIMAVLLAAKFGSAMSTGILFGATAWKKFKNSAAVRNKFVVASGKGSGGAAFAVPTEDAIGQLLIGNPDTKVSYMVYDDAPEGKDASMKFILDSQVLVFARQQSPTRRDPSFMKTFRLQGKYMVPGVYQSEDERGQVIKFDWSEDVEVTNSAAVVRLNIT